MERFFDEFNRMNMTIQNTTSNTVSQLAKLDPGYLKWFQVNIYIYIYIYIYTHTHTHTLCSKQVVWEIFGIDMAK